MPESQAKSLSLLGGIVTFEYAANVVTVVIKDVVDFVHGVL